MSLTSVPDGPLKEIVSQIGSDSRVSLFSTCKWLRQRMVYSGCLEYMPMRFPDPSVWFFDYIQVCTLSRVAKLPASLIKLTLDSNKEITRPIVHSGVKKLIIKKSVDSIGFVHLPKQLESLILNNHDGWISFASLPLLKRLHIGGRGFTQSLDGLPDTLTSLSISSLGFDQPLHALPPGLLYLEINSSMFNQPLDSLPTSLAELEISSTSEYDSLFDQPLSSLPQSLKTLTLETCARFNRPMDQLPEGLEELNIFHCRIFNQPLDHLPDGLVRLRVFSSTAFKKKLDNLPPNLQTLDLGGFLGESDIPKTLPPKLAKIKVHKSDTTSVYIAAIIMATLFVVCLVGITLMIVSSIALARK